MNGNRLMVAALAAGTLSLLGCAPSDGSREFAEGKAAYEAHDLRKAERAFEKVLALSATNADACVYLARTKLELGQIPAAKAAIGRAAALAGGDSDVRLLNAQIAWHDKDYTAAADGFAAIASDAGLDAAVRADGWTGLGIVEMTCNNRDEARLAFLTAIRQDRSNASAWYHLGLLYRDAFGYSEAALEQFSIYVRLDAEASPRVQRVQRTCIPELKETIARAATARPGASRRNSAASAKALGEAEAAWKKGNYKTARQQYQAALAADALSYPAALGLAQALLKTDATKAGQQKALEAYRQACILRPGATSTYLKTGELALRLGQVATAAEIYSRAVAANPTSLDALDGLIRALRGSGTKEKTRIARAYQKYRDSLAQPKRK